MPPVPTLMAINRVFNICIKSEVGQLLVYVGWTINTNIVPTFLIFNY